LLPHEAQRDERPDEEEHTADHDSEMHPGDERIVHGAR
jgi:hypothetical protein